jgi:hypothetical protein
LKSLYWLILFVSAPLITACVNQQCDDVRPEPALNIAFRKYTEPTRNPRQARDTTFRLLNAYAVGLEVKPFEISTEPVRNVRLRLSPLADQTTFVLLSAGAGTSRQTSTITVSYTRQPAFISQACGYEITFTNLSVTNISPNLDEAVVVVPTINPIRNEVHIQLFFRP